MDEKTIQVEKANKKLDFHKVLAAIGIVLIVIIIIGTGIWYMVQSAVDKAGSIEADNVVKVTTSSAKMKTATITASSSARN